jgi:hypothetical protein
MGVSLTVLKDLKQNNNGKYYLYNANGYIHLKSIPEGRYDGVIGESVSLNYSTYNDFREFITTCVYATTLGRYWAIVDENKPSAFDFLLNHGDNAGDFDHDHCCKLFEDFERYSSLIDNSGNEIMKSRYLAFYHVFQDAVLSGGVVMMG